MAYASDKDDDRSEVQKCRDWRENALRSWQPKFDAYEELARFVAGERYDQDEQQWNKDRRLVQIRGQEIQDTIRHIVAKTTEKPRNIEARAIDRNDDAGDGEIAVALIEQDWANPWKCFDSTLESAIHSCRKQRLGVMMMDWVPDYGPKELGGEIFDRYVRPERVMWDVEFEDPHHPLCNCFHERKRIDVRRARKIYKAPWLMPDKDCNVKHRGRSGQPVASGSPGERRWEPESYDDDKVTLDFYWYKNDASTKVEAKEGDPLDPGERYMSCMSGCGYRTDTEDQLRAAGKPLPWLGGMPLGEKGELPEEVPPRDEVTMEGGCPICGGPMDRIDVIDEDRTTLAFRNGKRLLIDAPFSHAPDEDKAVFDGPWPVPARSFPVFVLTAYVEPGDPVGPCDVDLMWNQQQAADQLRTIAIQRVFEHRNIWEFPLAGIVDRDGNRYEVRDDQDAIMFRDSTVSAQWDTTVKLHQATGLDPNWQTAYGPILDALTRYRPQLDIGSADENTRDIAVGTIERITHEAEVSTEHFIRRKNQALSKYAGVRWDYIRYTYTQARLSRLNMDGVDVMSRLRGDDMPGFDFIISEAPQFSGIDKARAEAWPALMNAYGQAAQLGLDPLQSIEIFAELNNLPKSVVRKFSKMLEEMQAKQAEAAMQAEQAAAAGLGPGPEAGLGEGGPAGSELDMLMGAEMDGGGMGLPPAA